MGLSQDMNYLLIGGIVGFASSAIGALVDYSISRRAKNPGEKVLPGCMLLVTGGLGFTGLVVTAAAYFLAHSLRPAILAGVGIFAGFTITFTILVMMWLLLHPNKGKPSNPSGKA